MQTKAKPRRVDFFDNDNDMEVLLMGELGLSSKAIAEATGLTTCQIGYRLNRGGVRRKEYRDGKGLSGYLLHQGVIRHKALMEVRHKLGA